MKCFEKFPSRLGCEGGGGEAALQKIPAGGGFPIDHLARHEQAGNFFDHQGFVEFVPTQSAGAGDGFGDGAGGFERDAIVLGFVGE